MMLNKLCPFVNKTQFCLVWVFSKLIFTELLQIDLDRRGVMV